MEGDTPGGFTRVIQSRLPVSKKKKERGREGERGKERKNINQPVKNKRGEKGELYLPPNEPPSFLSPSCLLFFFSCLCSLTLCLTYTLNLCQSLFFCFFLIPPPPPPTPTSLPIILSPSVSLRHVFQGPPSIDTVSTNSSPPVPSQEPLRGRWGARGGPSGGGGRWGEACWVRGDTAEFERRSREPPTS